MDNPVIQITTKTGHTVKAPLFQWVQALILRLEPNELIALMNLVQESQEPKIVLPQRQTIEADPEAWQRGFGLQERH